MSSDVVRDADDAELVRRLVDLAAPFELPTATRRRMAALRQRATTWTPAPAAFATETDETATPQDGFVRATDAALRLGISPQQVRTRLRRGEIPGAQRCGRAWLIPTHVLPALEEATP